MEALHEAVALRPADPRTALGDAVRLKEVGQHGAAVLVAVIGEHALEAVAGRGTVGQHALRQEAHHRLRQLPHTERGPAQGREGVDRRELPDPPDALEVADVEAVQADQLAGALRLDVAHDTAGPALAEQALLAQGEALEGGQAPGTGAETETAQQPPDAHARHPQAAVALAAKLVGDALRAVCGMGQSVGHNGLSVCRERRRGCRGGRPCLGARPSLP